MRVSRPPSLVDHAFRPRPAVCVVPSGESGLMLRSPEGKCLSLRGAAGRLWILLERGASPRTIRGLLQREYGMPSSRLDAELVAMLEQLLVAGVIERTG